MSTQPLAASARSLAPASPRGIGTLSRDLFRGGLAGLICGIVFFGLGGRVLMRVSALLNPEQQGQRTENGNVIGEVTLDGTLELILFAGVFGGFLAGFVWVIVREWLPASGWRRILLAGGAATCLGSFGMLTEENLDFRILSPPALHLAMFLLLIGGAGVGIAIADPLLDRVLPRGRGPGAVYLVLALPVGMLTSVIMLQALFQPQTALRILALALLAVLVMDCVRWRARYFGGVVPGWLPLAGRAGVFLACAAATLHFVLEAGEILA